MEYSQTELGWDEINYRVLVLSPLQRKILELMTSFIVGSFTQGEQSHHDQKCGASLHFFRFLKMVLGWFLPQWSPLESTLSPLSPLSGLSEVILKGSSRWFLPPWEWHHLSSEKKICSFSFVHQCPIQNIVHCPLSFASWGGGLKQNSYERNIKVNFCINQCMYDEFGLSASVFAVPLPFLYV